MPTNIISTGKIHHVKLVVSVIFEYSTGSASVFYFQGFPIIMNGGTVLPSMYGICDFGFSHPLIISFGFPTPFGLNYFVDEDEFNFPKCDSNVSMAVCFG